MSFGLGVDVVEHVRGLKSKMENLVAETNIPLIFIFDIAPSR
jgi:hypothetical protein